MPTPTHPDVDVMAAYAVKTWLETGHSLDDLRVAVDERLERGDPSAERLAAAIRAHEQQAERSR